MIKFIDWLDELELLRCLDKALDDQMIAQEKIGKEWMEMSEAMDESVGQTLH